MELTYQKESRIHPFSTSLMLLNINASGEKLKHFSMELIK